MEHVDVAEVDQPIVVQFVNKILAEAVHRHATAIRLRVVEEDGTPARADIHYYIDNDYVPVDCIRFQFYSAIVNRVRIMASLDYWKMDKRQTGQIKRTIDGISCVMSVSIEKIDKYEEVVIGVTRS